MYLESRFHLLKRLVTSIKEQGKNRREQRSGQPGDEWREGPENLHAGDRPGVIRNCVHQHKPTHALPVPDGRDLRYAAT